MKKVFLLFIIFVVGCSNDSHDLNDVKQNPYSDYENFSDNTGFAFDYDNLDITGINVNYVVGWTLDDITPKRYYVGDEIYGHEINSCYSSYFFNFGTLNNVKATIGGCDDAFYLLTDYETNEITVKGIIRQNSFGEMCLYPYKTEKSDFPLICPYDENTFEYYKSLSIIKLKNGTEVEVQPLELPIDETCIELDGEIYEAEVKYQQIGFGVFSQGRGVEATTIKPTASTKFLLITEYSVLE